MNSDLPEYFFRVRDTGASVFKVDSSNRHRRLEMDQIAVVIMRTGEIRPQGDRSLTPEDRAAIKTWIADRQETLDWRRFDDIARAVDHMNLTAHWAQTQATEDQLEAVTDALLMSMHDLRSVLVRKRAERLMADD
ncbi:MAG: hypothetical protein ACRBBQ_06470 [Cognatishimia sp.]